MIKSNIFKYFALSFGWIEMLCFSGFLYGLNSLHETMRIENLFSELCNNTKNISKNTDNSCMIQKTYYGYIMVTALVSQCVSALPFGVFFDKFGERYSKLLISLTFLFAGIFFAISFRVTPYLVFPAAILFGISTQVLIFCNVALGRLFPKIQNLIVSIYCGSLDTSTIIMTFFTLSFASGVSLFASFLSLGIVGFVVMFFSALFLMNHVDEYFKTVRPSASLEDNTNCQETEFMGNSAERSQNQNNAPHIENQSKSPLESPTGTGRSLLDKEDVNKDESLRQACAANNGETHQTKSFDTNVNNTDNDVAVIFQNFTNKKYPNLKSVFRSRFYLLQLAYFVILYFRFSFFLAQLSLQIHLNFSGSSSVAKLLAETNYFFICGILVSPFAGLIVDLSKKIFFKRSKPSQSEEDIYNSVIGCFAIPQLICCSFNLIYSITIIIPKVPTVYVTYLFLTLSRGFLFSLNSSYFLQAFPVKYFGKTLGITILIAGLISFIQYALFFEDLNKLNSVNYALIGFSCLAFLHPLVLLVVKAKK